MKNAIKLRAIFMGTSEFAAIILDSLIKENYNLVSVYTQPGKKSGRSQEIKPNQVKTLAEENKIPVFEPAILDDKTREEIASQKPDLIIVVAYGKIIPKSFLDIPGFGVINVHGSLLPKYRGPSPIQNAILNGEKETGATIMLMDEKIDSGDILSQKSIAIGEDDNYEDLSLKLSDLSSKLLLKTIPLLVERKIKPQKQDQTEATFCQLIERDDGKIIWDADAVEIFNKYRAFHVWPGIYTFWENENSTPKRIKLKKISFQENNPKEKHHVGEIFESDGKIAIQTGKGLVFPEIIQLEGKNEVNIREFLNGFPAFLGSILK